MPDNVVSRPATGRPKNRLLRSLPAADFGRLAPDLKTIRTPANHVFHRHGERIEHVYFPNGGVASVTALLADGTMVETAIVGSEGVVGIEAFLGDTPVAAGPTMMQVPDTDAERLSVVALRRELARHDALFTLMGRYAQVAVALMMQSVACMARHDLQERCARSLLMTHDRVGGNAFELSHEALSIMIGVRRQSVTVVAGGMQTAGLISYRHGHVKVLDRKGLEATSCECYAMIRAQFDAV